MAFNPNEFFYGSSQYDPPLWYPGYDQSWVLGRKATPSAAGGSKSKDQEDKKPDKKAPVEVKMTICCEGCVEKLKDKLIDLDGVVSVSVKVDQNRVIVEGDVKPEAVMKVVKKISSSAQLVKKEPKKQEKKH
ncbi:hypothetical protein R1sor_011846 [Riccia sorocarpa]|uniref:HMA domain-containing protein n=1 Tax=Riccia sorocarpa TaxID=122646 RepID=A0ABD3I217_9MARC